MTRTQQYRRQRRIAALLSLGNTDADRRIWFLLRRLSGQILIDLQTAIERIKPQ